MENSEISKNRYVFTALRLAWSFIQCFVVSSTLRKLARYLEFEALAGLQPCLGWFWSTDLMFGTRVDGVLQCDHREFR